MKRAVCSYTASKGHPEDALVQVGAEERRLHVVARKAPGHLGEVVGAEGEELCRLGDLSGRHRSARQLDHRADREGEFHALLVLERDGHRPAGVPTWAATVHGAGRSADSPWSWITRMRRGLLGYGGRDLRLLDCHVGRCWPRFRRRELFNPKKTTEVRHEGAGLQGPRQEELGRGSESVSYTHLRAHE